MWRQTARGVEKERSQQRGAQGSQLRRQKPLDGWRILEQAEPAVMEGDRPMSTTRTLRLGSPVTPQTIGLRRWREGKVRPIPGSSPHDRPVSRGIFSSLKESLLRSLPRHRIPHQSSIILGAQYAFSKAWRNLSGPMGFHFKPKIKTKSWTGTRPPPAGRPRRQTKDRAGRNTLFLIVRR